MDKPYLIQRGKFVDNEGSKGIDRILSFDYMGSFEFEDDSLFRSLKRVRGDISSYTQFQYLFNSHPSKAVTVFCKKEQQEFVGSILEQLADREIRLKEYCDLDKFISGDERGFYNDFWWDLDQDWMFWKSNPDFDLKFNNAINDFKK